MSHESVQFEESFFVKSISQVRHFFCRSLQSLPPASSGTWALIYVDSGTLHAFSGSYQFCLFQHELLLWELSAQALSCFALKGTPSLIACVFSCSSPLLYALFGRILYSSRADRYLLAQLSDESAYADAVPFAQRAEPAVPSQSAAVPTVRFDASCPFDNPAAPFQKQLLARMLRRLFLRLPPISSACCLTVPCFLPAASRHQYLQLLRYLKTHLHLQLSLEKICRDNLLGRSALEKLFHDNGWNGVMDCFIRLKINAAKQMLRGRSMSITQIAVTLGYSSVSYFTRQFKKVTKMTPTQYADFLQEHPGDVIPFFFY